MNDDERARKRTAIGLSPQRPTAQAAPQRPPEQRRNDRRRVWTLIGLVAAMMLATVLLVVVRMAGASTSWPEVLRSVAGMRGRLLNPTEAGVRFSSVLAAETQLDMQASSIHGNFGEPGSTMGELARPDAFVIGREGLDGVYRMRLWPDNVAWVIVGPECLTSYQIETEALVDAATPSGHAVLVGRFHDDRNFHLFGVNGARQFEALMVKDGVWTSLHAPEYDAVINPAGVKNTLVLHDDGATMQFFVNGESLYQESDLRFPMGQPGLAGRSGHAAAQIDFNRFQMSASSCQGSPAAK